MPNAFVPLREWLAPVAARPFEPEREAHAAEEAVPVEIAVESDIFDEVLRETRFFRAALRDALEERVNMLAREIAIEVVARELELAPVDIAAVVERASERYEAPLSIRAHPDEAHRLGTFENVIEDASVRRGDVLLTVVGGTIDASLGMRLERVLTGLCA